MGKKSLVAGAVAMSLAVVGCGGTTTSGIKTTTMTSYVATAAPTATVTVTPQPSEAPEPPPAASVTARSSYGPNGAYAVGRAQGGLDDFIPAGRYRATGDAGYLYHCSSVVCQQGMDNPESVDSISTDTPVIVEIPASDVAIYLWDVTLRPVS